ncbi:MAG: RHS repeat-associated core domain-containing protein, partial [Chloroflexi bacterium]|nr:RHS repeat-associated core domain-containing protein [Chloroflexota bacterium]
QDHLTGTATVTDASGNSAGSIKYKPYGETRLSSGSLPAQKFTGQRLDDVGLYYYGARYYDPGLARFASADPLMPRPADPQALNRYSYVLDNPLRYIDPTGYEPDDGTVTIPFFPPPGPARGGNITLHVLGANGDWVSYRYNQGGLSGVSFRVTRRFEVQENTTLIQPEPTGVWWMDLLQAALYGMGIHRMQGNAPVLASGSTTVEGYVWYGSVPGVGVGPRATWVFATEEIGYTSWARDFDFGEFRLDGYLRISDMGIRVFSGQFAPPSSAGPAAGGPTARAAGPSLWPRGPSPAVFGLVAPWPLLSPIIQYSLVATYKRETVPVIGGSFTVDLTKQPAEIR